MLSILCLKYIRKLVTSHPHHYHLNPTRVFFLAGFWSSLLLSPPGPPSLLVLQRNPFKTLKSDYVSLLKTFRRLLNSLRVKVRFSLGPPGPASSPTPSLMLSHPLLPPRSQSPQPHSPLCCSLNVLRMRLPQSNCTCLSLCLEHCSVRNLRTPSSASSGSAQMSPPQRGLG